MPKSVNPARPAQAGLSCLLSGTDCRDENGGNRRCTECSLSVRSAEFVSFFHELPHLALGLMIAYGQNGEALRPQQGFPVRLIPPGFEGIFLVARIEAISLSFDPGCGPPAIKNPACRPGGSDRIHLGRESCRHPPRRTRA
jgi:Oxidoreductase molybdopterin binding domain